PLCYDLSDRGGAMMDLSILLTAVKTFGTVVSTVKGGAAIKAWIARDKRDPLGKALDRTISKYEDTFQNIAEQLLSVFGKPAFIAELQRLTETGAQDVADVAERLAEAAEFYDPEGHAFA